MNSISRRDFVRVAVSALVAATVLSAPEVASREVGGRRWAMFVDVSKCMVVWLVLLLVLLRIMFLLVFSGLGLRGMSSRVVVWFSFLSSAITVRILPVLSLALLVLPMWLRVVLSWLIPASVLVVELV